MGVSKGAKFLAGIAVTLLIFSFGYRIMFRLGEFWAFDIITGLFFLLAISKAFYDKYHEDKHISGEDIMDVIKSFILATMATLKNPRVMVFAFFFVVYIIILIHQALF